jgi:hypothetical protein
MKSRFFPKSPVPLLLVAWLLFQPLVLSSRHDPIIMAPQTIELGDRYADLAIGVYHEDIDGEGDCGAAQVFYGKQVIAYNKNEIQFWSQYPSSVLDYPEDDDKFGSALAAGDFNGDGYQDLAIGVPLEDLTFNFTSEVDAGAVHVLYGTHTKLSDTGDDFMDQETYGGVSGDNEYFGAALVSGDFNGDGFDDLAIGSPGEKVDSADAAGVVTVVYGASGGISSLNQRKVLHQNMSGIADGAQAQDQFGMVLAVGDFNADSYDDLVVGVPYEDVGDDQGSGVEDAGAVNIFYGSGDGLTSDGAQFLHQDSPEVNDSAEAHDHFGWSLATGWLNRDQYDDLAIGIPQETIGEVTQAGAVSVLFGFSPGIVTLADQLWHQDVPGLLGDKGQDYDRFGWSVASGDFDMNGIDDLAIGVPMEDFEEKEDAGVVHVLYSRNTGPHYDNNQLWHHDLPNVNGGPAESHDHFGHALVAGDINGDFYDELVVGVPGDEVDGKTGAGSANILPGGASGLSDHMDGKVTQPDFPGEWRAPGVDDNFGNALVVLPAPPPPSVYLPLIFNNLTSQ